MSVKACRVLFHQQNDMYSASSSISVYAHRYSQVRGRVICAEGLHFSAFHYYYHFLELFCCWDDRFWLPRRSRPFLYASIQVCMCEYFLRTFLMLTCTFICNMYKQVQRYGCVYSCCARIVAYICFARSTDSDRPRNLLRKPRFLTLRSKSVDGRAIHHWLRLRNLNQSEVGPGRTCNKTAFAFLTSIFHYPCSAQHSRFVSMVRAVRRTVLRVATLLYICMVHHVWVVSEVCVMFTLCIKLDIHSPRSVRGLWALSWDFCAEWRSKVCATKSADGYNPYSAHNIHLFTHIEHRGLCTFVLS